MSAQTLNPRSTRRVARSTGLDVIRAWSHGGYTFSFVTADHRHGWWSKKDGVWGWDEDGGLSPHYSSCHELFPAPPVGLGVTARTPGVTAPVAGGADGVAPLP